MSTCLTCTHATFRDQDSPKRDKMLRDMEKLGMLNCLKSPLRATFYRINAEGCEMHSPVDDETAAKREEFGRTVDNRQTNSCII